ncbi:protein JASON [Cornus florida]|uniref:protein JASON n=1 Tax=Cornus florida TaxID=4283 RepID=UPI002898DDF7|nr:protein JASON [Cornus florida]
MGCFFGCFRIKDEHRPHTPLVSEAVPLKANEHVLSRNRLSRLLLSEVEEKDGSPHKDNKNHVFSSPQPGAADGRELKDEAKFLKACGTLLETPAEIRKASEKIEHSSFHDGDFEPSQFHSWLPNKSIKKLILDKQPDQPSSPIKFCEVWAIGSISSENTPSRQNSRRVSTTSTEGSGVGTVCMATKIQAHQTRDITTSLVSPWPVSAKMQSKSKFVHFECDSDAISRSSRSSSCWTASQSKAQSESAGNCSVSKLSAFPTPLKLTDEMQTPGTEFPAYLQKMENGKNPCIRSQYVHTVLNPVEKFSKWKVIKEEDYDSHQLSVNLRESLEQADDATPKSEHDMRGTLVEKEMNVEANLSSLLKPHPIKCDGNDQPLDSLSSKNVHFGRTHGDRPILGMVAAHWNEDEPSRISPKWWDGNGIPNSTNKYKEDQKVKWHATPFEERLEKALSEDVFISQRKHINGEPPIHCDEKEESDTAQSRLQSATHFSEDHKVVSL